jgi:hypothetical protein
MNLIIKHNIRVWPDLQRKRRELPWWTAEILYLNAATGNTEVYANDTPAWDIHSAVDDIVTGYTITEGPGTKIVAEVVKQFKADRLEGR